MRPNGGNQWWEPRLGPKVGATQGWEPRLGPKLGATQGWEPTVGTKVRTQARCDPTVGTKGGNQGWDPSFRILSRQRAARAGQRAGRQPARSQGASGSRRAVRESQKVGGTTTRNPRTLLPGRSNTGNSRSAHLHFCSCMIRMRPFLSIFGPIFGGSKYLCPPVSLATRVRVMCKNGPEIQKNSVQIAVPSFRVIHDTRNQDSPPHPVLPGERPGTSN